MTNQDLRTMSLDFRRISSNILNASMDDANVMLHRFKKYIDGTKFIAGLLAKAIDGINYDFRECFIISTSDWNEMAPPVDESCHIKAQYDYLTYLCENNIDVISAASGYYHSSGKYVDIIREFFQSAFKPLIDFVNDAISKEMILNEQIQNNIQSMIQNFNGPLYGSAVQGAGVLTSYNLTVNNSVTDITQLIERTTKSVDALDLSEVVKEDIKDDLDVISEQVQSATPKKNRLQKALGGVKKFSHDFILKLVVDSAVNTALTTDWAALIGKVELFINSLS